MTKKLRLITQFVSLILLSVFIVFSADAQVSITQVGVPFTQDFENFDGLADPVNWVTSDAPGVAASTWQGQGTGIGTGGGKWSYGLEADANRALGFLPSSSRAIYADISFVNNTGDPITSLAVSYVGEHWRSALDGRNNGWAVSYKIGDGDFIDVTQLTYVAPNDKPTGALNGNLPENSELKSHTIPSLSIPNGATFVLRFFGDNGTGGGSRQGVAFDDFSLTVSADAPTQVAAPTFDPPAGTYYSPQNVEITTITADADVFYSTVSETGPWTPYTVAVLVDETTTLWAYAAKTGLDDSDVVSAEYFFPVPAFITLPYFEDFEIDLGDCYTYSVSGPSKYWEHSVFGGNGYAMMNGHGSTMLEEDWLIVPGVDVEDHMTIKLNFETAWNFGVDDENNYLKLYYSTNYAGVGDPTTATWTELPFTKPATGSYTWEPSGDIVLSGISGTVWFGFKYHYSESFRRWHVDNIQIEEILYDATFNVDMTDAVPFDPLTDAVYLAGSFPDAFWNEPGTNPGLQMQPQVPGSMIYTITRNLPPGNYEYKYFRNAGWGGGEWDGGSNRMVNVEEDTVFNDVWGIITSDPEITWANLQWPPNGVIDPGTDFNVYAQVYAFDVTGTGVAPVGLNGWIGYNTTNATTVADFATGWTWLPAVFNTQAGANDEFMANLGTAVTDPGTYYYVSRFQLNGDNYVYGGFNGGFWDGVDNVSGELIVNDPPLGNILIINDAEGYPNVPVTIEIEIENYDAFTGFQVDIPLPAGFSYVANSVLLNAARENGHLIEAEVLAGDVLRILSYHPSSLPFVGNDGIVATFELNTPSFAGNHMLLAVDPIIGDALGVNILTSSVDGEVTLLSGGNIAQINDLEIDIGEDAVVELEIINSDAFTGFQMDILLPAGMTYEPGSIALTTRAGDHEISATMLDGNILRVLSWSLTNAIFTGNDGAVATFILDYGTALPDDYPLVLDDAIIGDVNGNNIVTMMNDGLLTLNIVLENIMEIIDTDGLANLPETIELAITNNLPFTGFQLDVLLPAGFSYIDGTVALDPLRADDHEIAATMIDDNTLRILSFSHTNAVFAGTEGTVATFDLMMSPAPGMYTLVIDNAIIGNIIGQNILTNTIDGEIEVLPSTSCPDDFDVCIDEEPFALTGGDPEGGTYAGPGVENGIFNPSVAGAGTHEITYSYTFPNDVTGICSYSITVNELPLVTCPVSFTVCEDEAPFALTGGTPLGGVYSGPGVENGIFDPSIAGLGDHLITYTYIDNNTCVNSCEFTLTVAPILEVSVSIEAESTVVCDGYAAVLTATPVNGGDDPVYMWYVNGTLMPGNEATLSFYPLNGDVVTSELFSSEQCNDGPAMSNAVTITVNPWVEVSITIESDQNEVCEGTTVMFSVSEVQNPGSDPHYQWQVNGVNVGENAPTYSYIPENDDVVQCILTSSEPCTFDNPVTSNAITMVIYPIPVVTWEWEYDTICINWGPIPLFGGSPEGGVYSGIGVEDEYFIPTVAGVGTHELTYTYTSEFGCTNYTTISIFVDECVGVEELSGSNSFELYPNPTTEHLHISMNAGVEVLQMAIYDVSGNIVRSFERPDMNRKHLIDVRNLQPGVFIIQITTEKGVASKRFIVM